MFARYVAAAFVFLFGASAALGEDATSQPAGEPASQPANWLSLVQSQPATSQAEPAPSPSWPPGLLMDGLGAISARKPLDDIGLRLYGFTEAGYTGRLTGGQPVLFGHLFDGRKPNQLELNQLIMTAERPYDSNKPFDVGFRIDGLYGSDAFLTHSAGLFENAGTGTDNNWADMPQAYFQTWLKTGQSSGLELTAGKFFTPFGYEAFYASQSPMYSHSYIFDTLPLCYTGVKANYIFNSQASAYFGVVEGSDVFEDNNDAVSYFFGGVLNGQEQIDGHARTTYYLNIGTGPEQADNVNNYRTVVDQTLTYWWTSKLSQSVNADVGTEEDVPDIGRANWYGVANYFTYVWSDYVSSTLRSEWFQDTAGARLGVAGNFVENTIGLTITPFPHHNVLKNLSIRPEFRWDQSDQPVFGDDRNYQLTAAVDVVFKF